MSKVDTFEFPSVGIYEIDEIVKKYIGNQCAINYDEHEDITTIQKEHNNEEVMVGRMSRTENANQCSNRFLWQEDLGLVLLSDSWTAPHLIHYS